MTSKFNYICLMHLFSVIFDTLMVFGFLYLPASEIVFITLYSFALTIYIGLVSIVTSLKEENGMYSISMIYETKDISKRIFIILTPILLFSAFLVKFSYMLIHFDVPEKERTRIIIHMHNGAMTVIYFISMLATIAIIEGFRSKNKLSIVGQKQYFSESNPQEESI